MSRSSAITRSRAASGVPPGDFAGSVTASMPDQRASSPASARMSSASPR
ncbi:hypothetical protein J2S69_000953 [Glycomyces lechevalierae]|uniref:Uncharacterized protein n=1 Tax=Glycomyces lechevalierae TaxID=256034 RepID=A0ABU2AJ40_9ACTN|nr:hypothetical protein [Glycomyces lechevalierae]